MVMNIMAMIEMRIKMEFGIDEESGNADESVSVL